MESGTIKYINPEKGFGFIAPDDLSDDVYFRIASSQDDHLLRNGLKVSYSVTQGKQGPIGSDITPTESADLDRQTATGRVKFWNEEKGFGFVARDDGGIDLHLNRRFTRFKGDQAPIEGDEVLVDFVDMGGRNPTVVSLEITVPAPWKPTGIPLLDFADMGNRHQMTDQLAALAEPEDWDNRRTPTGGKPILDSYLRYTFVRLQEEGKIEVSADERYCAFNTGLVTLLQEEIFALFESSSGPRHQRWRLVGFRKRSDRTLLAHFGHNLPDLANYFDDPSVLLYDRRLQLHIDIDHVIEHIERFPDPLNSNEFLARQAIQAAEVNTRSRVYRNYKAAIPQWYKDANAPTANIQLLLPLCLRQPDRADLALVVDRIGGAYRGNTVLTLDMAYRNARLLARPDSDWLIP